MKTLKITLAVVLLSTVAFAQTKETKKANATIKPIAVETKAAPVAAPVAEAKPVAAPQKQSELKWDEETHNFGQIEQKKPATYEFTFTNNTKESVTITNVRPACGCTAADYTKTAIKPGEKGFVKATYNAASPGNFQKSITVTTNENGVDATKVLTFKGEVLKAETEEKSILLK